MAFQNFISLLQENSHVTAALAVVGLLYLSCVILGFLSGFLRIFVLSGQSLRRFGPKGSWALVTGASDGIGKEFALQLAQRGFNIILVSRTESKLVALAEEIETRNANANIKTKILSMDFSRNDDSDYEKLASLIEGLDISILINNVGRSHEFPTPFLLTPQSVINDIVAINILGTLRVTQLIIPGMMQKKRGLILTMGSFAGLYPSPLLATYSGSKAFLQNWSSALGAELQSHGVEVQLVLSFLVTSAMSKIRKTSITTPNPKAFVKATLNKIGVRVGGLTGSMTPYWSHALMHWVSHNTVGVGSSFMVKLVLKMHEDIRRRALRKIENQKRNQ